MTVSITHAELVQVAATWPSAGTRGTMQALTVQLTEPPAPWALPWSHEGLGELHAAPVDIEPPTPFPPPEPEPDPVHLPPLAIFSRETEGLLGEFFAQGVVLVEGSLFGQMIEAAMRTSHTSIPCQVCGCSGFDASGADCKKCHGTAYTVAKRIPRGSGDSRWSTVRCGACKGLGRDVRAMAERWTVRALLRDVGELGGVNAAEVVAVAVRVATELGRVPNRWKRVVDILSRMAWDGLAGTDAHPVDHESVSDVTRVWCSMLDHCIRCNGTGYVMPITVRETGADGSSPPAADVVAIEKHARIGCVFARVRGVDPLQADALEAYHGPIGNRWGATDHGRGFSLWPLTGPGRKLAEEAHTRSTSYEYSASLSAHDLLAEERAREKLLQKPDIRLRNMLKQADAAARNLRDTSKRAWVRAVIEAAA